MKRYLFLLFIPLFAVGVAPVRAATLSCAILAADLRQNAANADVAILQNFLIGQGYLKTKATGFFGPATLKAVQAFQKANGLYAAGFVGPQTRAKMQSLCAVTMTIGAGSGAATSSQVSTTILVTPSFGTSTATGSGGSAVNSSSGGNSVIVSLYPDPKAAYLQMRAAYDAAPTLDAFVAVSSKYASAARQDDAAAQKSDMQNLSFADKADYLNSNIKSVIPTVGEIVSVGVVQNGPAATIVLLPSPASGKTAKGLVILLFENGAWKLQSEKWLDDSGSGIEPLPSASGG
jgi:peptidoglycan hydrolase-like protein with peptidoglycan-binding domain